MPLTAPRVSKRKWNPDHPDARRAVHRFKLDLVEMNLGHIFLTQKQAMKAVADAVISTNTEADRAKVCGLLAEWWFCEG